ncbi:MAG: MotA/TolQ/ExbB proton channel family protein [Bryobacteraceae bacterium]
MSEAHVPPEFMPTPTPSRGSQTMNGSAIGQAVLAISMAAGAYLVLIYFQQYFGQGLRYRQMFFVHWTEFLCLALACWSLFALLARWRKCFRRAASISHSAFPQSLPQDDEGLEQLVVALRVKGRQYGDERGAIRAERLIGEFRASGDVASVAALLRAESEAAQVEIDSSYAPVRVFAWTIPLLGLIGTILGIGQALSEFAIFLASGSQKQEQIRAALYQATYNLGSAFEAILVAVLLTVIVSATYLLLQHKEKALLRNLDDLCRTGLLPLMRKNSSGSDLSRPGALEAQDIVIEQLSLLRSDLASANSQLAEWTMQSLSQGNATKEEISRHLSATEALHEALSESLNALIESTKTAQQAASDAAKPAPRGRKRTGEKHEEGGEAPLSPLHDEADTKAIRTTLLELRDSIGEVRPVLRQLAAHLREQAGEGEPHQSVAAGGAA